MQYFQTLLSARGMILKKRQGMCKRNILDVHPELQQQMLKVIHLIKAVVCGHGERLEEHLARQASKVQKPLDQIDSIDYCEPRVC